MYSDYLAHFGVKGMKWGHRKKEEQNKRYGKNQRQDDYTIYGRRGVKRINRRMNKGQTHKQASRRELFGQVAKGVGAFTIGTAAVALAANPSARKTLVDAGRKAVSNTFSKAQGIRVDSIGKYYDPGKDIVGKLLKRG